VDNTKKIGLTTAVLICLNTIIGAGLFINPQPLTKIAGPLGFIGYLISAIIMTPLIISIAELARLKPVSGGMYVYPKSYLGQWIGFFGGWCYFIGRTVTVAILNYKFATFFQARLPILENIPTLALTFFMIFFLILLNLLGASVGGKIQYVFTAMKSTPILFTLFLSLGFFDPSFFQFQPEHFANLYLTIPFVVFAFQGFEIICSIGNMIEDSAKNLRKAILISFCIAVCVAVVFQFTLFGCLGSALIETNEPILMLGLKALANYPLLGHIANSLVFAAMLGGGFSILTSNCWNLHVLAANNHLPFANILTKITSNNIPWVGLLIEGAVGCFILRITQNQASLQSMGVFATFIAFLLSAIAAVVATKQNENRLIKISTKLALISCSFILYLCLSNIIRDGVSFSFLSIFAIGLGLGAIKFFTSKSNA